MSKFTKGFLQTLKKMNKYSDYIKYGGGELSTNNVTTKSLTVENLKQNNNPGLGETNPGLGEINNTGLGENNPGLGEINNTGLGENNPGLGEINNTGLGEINNTGLGETNPGLGENNNTGLGEINNTGLGEINNTGLGETNPGLGENNNTGLGETNPGLGEINNTGLGETNPGLGENNLELGETIPGLEQSNNAENVRQVNIGNEPEKEKSLYNKSLDFVGKIMGRNKPVVNVNIPSTNDIHLKVNDIDLNSQVTYKYYLTLIGDDNEGKKSILKKIESILRYFKLLDKDNPIPIDKLILNDTILYSNIALLGNNNDFNLIIKMYNLIVYILKYIKEELNLNDLDNLNLDVSIDNLRLNKYNKINSKYISIKEERKSDVVMCYNNEIIKEIQDIIRDFLLKLNNNNDDFEEENKLIDLFIPIIGLQENNNELFDDIHTFDTRKYSTIDVTFNKLVILRENPKTNEKKIITFDTLKQLNQQQNQPKNQPENQLGLTPENQSENQLGFNPVNQQDTQPENQLGFNPVNQQDTQPENQLGFNPENQSENQPENQLGFNPVNQPENQLGFNPVNQQETQPENQLGFNPVN